MHNKDIRKTSKTKLRFYFIINIFLMLTINMQPCHLHHSQELINPNGLRTHATLQYYAMHYKHITLLKQQNLLFLNGRQPWRYRLIPLSLKKKTLKKPYLLKTFLHVRHSNIPHFGNIYIYIHTHYWSVLISSTSVIHTYIYIYIYFHWSIPKFTR